MIPVAIFCRPPAPGRVKTRLARAIGDARAASLYAAFLSDTIERCRSIASLEPELWVAGDPRDPALAPAGASLRRREQTEGDLGVRMSAAIESAIAVAGAGLVVGSDAPTVPAALLDLAVHALDSNDAVFGPAADGGFYLVAARTGLGAVFRGVRWSTSHALADSLERARAASLRVARLPPWYDVDTVRDLALLALHLRLDPSAAPATARALVEPVEPIAHPAPRARDFPRGEG